MKKVLYILFHRSVLVALSLLAQVVTLVVMVNIFPSISTASTGAASPSA